MQRLVICTHIASVGPAALIPAVHTCVATAPYMSACLEVPIVQQSGPVWP